VAVVIERVLHQRRVQLIEPINVLLVQRPGYEAARPRRLFRHDAGYRLSGEVLPEVL
jgi:hypothetical protein